LPLPLPCVRQIRSNKSGGSQDQARAGHGAHRMIR
jgi:hypothetical protein